MWVMDMFMTLAFTGQKVSNYTFSDMQLIIYEYCIHLHKALRGVGGERMEGATTTASNKSYSHCLENFPQNKQIQKKTTKSKKVWDIAKSRTFLGGKFTASNEYTRKAINKPSIHLKKLKIKTQKLTVVL